MNFYVKSGVTPYNFGSINLRCPACRHNGAFHAMPQIVDAGWHHAYKENGQNRADQFKAGMRVCPNQECRALIFYVEDKNQKRVIFPPEIIDFDATNLPDDILSSLEEAIKAHAAGCYRAAALMIRRTLEELCDDKSATGKDLKARISALSSVAVIPSELLNAADELRILGNDAAHIEAKSYDKIGEEESELAIELTKELLKAVYQYTKLVARLQSLKRSKTTP